MSERCWRCGAPPLDPGARYYTTEKPLPTCITGCVLWEGRAVHHYRCPNAPPEVFTAEGQNSVNWAETFKNEVITSAEQSAAPTERKP